MDDAKKLIHWAVNLKPEYKIEISNFDWPQRFGLNLSDYHFKFKHNGNNYDGRGTSISAEIALVKAIVESIERTVIDRHGLRNSNGVAAHFDQDQAIENATCELIERDIFLCNYLCPKAGVLEINNDQLPETCRTILKLLKDQNVDVRFYELGTILNRVVVLAVSNGFKHKNPFGCIVGLGSNLKESSAIEIALGEVSRNTITYIDREICQQWTQSEKDFFIEANQNFSISEHSKLALSEQYGCWLWKYFIDKQEYPIMDNDFNLNEIQIKILDTDEVFCELGIKVVQAQSEVMQNLFFHRTQRENVNLLRLERYLNSPVKYENLNLRTHPLA